MPTTCGGDHSTTVHSTLAGMPITLILSVTSVPLPTSSIAGGGPSGKPSCRLNHSGKRSKFETSSQACSSGAPRSRISATTTLGAIPRRLVERDNDGPADPDVVLEGRLGALDLAFVRLAAQLPGQFRALGRAGRSQRVSLRDQPARRVDHGAVAAVGGGLSLHELVGLALLG